MSRLGDSLVRLPMYKRGELSASVLCRRQHLETSLSLSLSLFIFGIIYCEHKRLYIFVRRLDFRSRKKYITLLYDFVWNKPSNSQSVQPETRTEPEKEVSWSKDRYTWEVIFNVCSGVYGFLFLPWEVPTTSVFIVSSSQLSRRLCVCVWGCVVNSKKCESNMYISSDKAFVGYFVLSKSFMEGTFLRVISETLEHRRHPVTERKKSVSVIRNYIYLFIKRNYYKVPS